MCGGWWVSDDNGNGNGNGNGEYKSGSLTLPGAVAMGTGVMIGAGIFALTGQIAELAGGWFPLVFLAAAVVAALSAYSYVKLSNDDPSAGGIGMYLTRLYGKTGLGGTVAAGMALLMYFSMVINEALVARTFGQYVMRLFVGPDEQVGGTLGRGEWQTPALAVGLLVLALGVNVLANKFIDKFQLVMAAVKILGIAAFAGAGLWVGGLAWDSFIGKAGAGEASPQQSAGWAGVVAAVALGILSYKGFTTITNDGDELKNPKKNVGRAIWIALAICVALYLLVALAVGGSLSIAEIVRARDYALAEAARPAFGQWGLWLTVALAIVACVSGVIASVFAVSRMLAMLVEMKLVPFKEVGIPGRRQYTTLVYTIVFATLLAVLFDLARIASLGAIFYLIMDMAIHWGVLTRVRREIGANAAILIAALALDAVVLAAFCWVKATTDPLILLFAAIGLLVIFAGEWWYLTRHRDGDADEDAQPEPA
jgi:amino acid transporter